MVQMERSCEYELSGLKNQKWTVWGTIENYWMKEYGHLLYSTEVNLDQDRPLSRDIFF